MKSLPSRGRPGFSLIEILAAMVVMSLLLLALSTIFSVSQQAMHQGLNAAEKNAGGRAAIDYMARELSQALVDDVLTMGLYSDTSGIRSPDAIAFATLVNTPDASDERAYKQVVYFVQQGLQENREDFVPYTRNALVRGVRTSDPQAHTDPLWSFQAASDAAGRSGGTAAALDTAFPTFASQSYGLAMVLDNILTLEIWVYPEGSTTAQPGYRSDQHGLPAYIELYVEVLSADDARAASLVTDPTYADKHSKRFFRRVYLNNIGTTLAEGL